MIRRLLFLLLVVTLTTAYQYHNENDLVDDVEGALKKEINEDVEMLQNIDNTVKEEDESHEGNDEEIALKDLDEDENDALDYTKPKRDPLWGGGGFRWPRVRVRVPRIRVPRIRVPRMRLPRIRLPRIRFPRIRFPRTRLPTIPLLRTRVLRRIRLGLRRIRFRFRRRRRSSKRKPTKPKLPGASGGCTQAEADAMVTPIRCDPQWVKNTPEAAPLMSELFNSTCIKHSVCMSCAGSNGYNVASCQTRLKSDLVASCQLLKIKYPAQVAWCIDKVFWFHIQTKLNPPPVLSSKICPCIGKDGDPNKAVDLSKKK